MAASDPRSRPTDEGPRPAEIARGAMNRLKVLAEVLRQRGDPEAAAASFAAALSPLHAVAPLTLTVDARGFTFDGVEVLGGDLIARVLVEGLIGEGLARVVVLAGAPPEEVAQLGRLLARDWRQRASTDDDLELTSWKARFQYVHLELVARSMHELADVEGVSAEAMVRRLLHRLGLDWLEDDGGQLDGEVAALMAELEAIPDGEDAPPPDTDLRARTADGLLAELKAHASAPRDDAALGVLVFETMRHLSSPDDVRRFAGRVADRALDLLATGETDAAGAVVRRAALMAEADLFPTWGLGDALREGLSPLYGPRAAEVIVAQARRAAGAGWAPFLFTWAQLAPSAALAEVLAVGARLDDLAQRQAIADGIALLADAGALGLRELLASTPDDRLPIVLLALRRRADATLVEPILARERSGSSAVREAVLIALREHQSPRIKQVVRAALADPDRAVRIEALRYVSVYRDAEAAAPTLDTLRAGGPAGADEAELRAWAIAAALTGREPALGPLEALAGEVAKRPELARASLHGLRAAGAAGRAALEHLGRTHPELRPELRGLLGGTNT